MKLLLIACSKNKHPYLFEGPAQRIYCGRTFRLALRYAKENGLKPCILSAMYGIIEPDDIIETYNKKKYHPWTGPWPKGNGFYVGGGPRYFGLAPSRFRPLVPLELKLKAVPLQCYMRALLKDKSSAIVPGEMPLVLGGVPHYIFKRLLKGPITQEALYEELVGVFGSRKSLVTLKLMAYRQLKWAVRMAAEGNFNVHQSDKGEWWITRI